MPHLVLSGHGNYNEYFPRWEPELERIMPLNAKQLLVHGGVTSARDLGIPLERGIAIRDAINAGEVVGSPSLRFGTLSSEVSASSRTRKI